MIAYIYGPVNSGKTKISINKILSEDAEFTYIKATETGTPPECVFPYFKNIVIGNAQFISEEHILSICNWAREANINIYFIGLVYDKNTNEYPSHKALFRLSDENIEIEKKCDCGEKAIYNMCVNSNDEAELYTEDINTKAKYKAVCPKCYKKLEDEAKSRESMTLAHDVFIECFR